MGSTSKNKTKVGVLSTVILRAIFYGEEDFFLGLFVGIVTPGFLLLVCFWGSSQSFINTFYIIIGNLLLAFSQVSTLMHLYWYTTLNGNMKPDSVFISISK